MPTRGAPPEPPQSGWVHYVPDAATAMREAKTAAGEQDVMVHGAGLAQSPTGRSTGRPPAPADEQVTAP